MPQPRLGVRARLLRPVPPQLFPGPGNSRAAVPGKAPASIRHGRGGDGPGRLPGIQCQILVLPNPAARGEPQPPALAEGIPCPDPPLSEGTGTGATSAPLGQESPSSSPVLFPSKKPQQDWFLLPHQCLSPLLPVSPKLGLLTAPTGPGSPLPSPQLGDPLQAGVFRPWGAPFCSY